MAEAEQVNTPQAEENSVTNPSTQADEKKDVPYGRFQEINQKMRGFEQELLKERESNAKLKAQQEEARQESLKKNQEFETLYNETNSELGKIKEQNKAYEAKELEESDRLDAKIPEDQRVFTKGMSNAVKAQYIEQLQSNVNAGKTDSSRAGTTVKGEMGGYSNPSEWAQKDPAGFTKHLEESVEGYIK